MGPRKAGPGVRMGGRNDGGLLSRGAAGLYRVAGDNTKNCSAHSACRQAEGGAERLADHPWRQSYQNMHPGSEPGNGSATLALEYPLPLRPKLQGFASVGIPTRNIQHKKGDTSN